MHAKWRCSFSIAVASCVEVKKLQQNDPIAFHVYRSFKMFDDFFINFPFFFFFWKFALAPNLVGRQPERRCLLEMKVHGKEYLKKLLLLEITIFRTRFSGGNDERCSFDKKCVQRKISLK